MENKNNSLVICDSAEPKSIAELNVYGIKWLQDLEEIVIDPIRCPNTAKEFQEYELEKDREGNFKAHFPDKNNHSIDAVRYSREWDMRNTKVR